MASAQCYKPIEQSCNQGHHSSSLDQKASGVASWAFKSSSETNNHATHGTHTQTQCYAKTQANWTDQGMAKTQTPHCYSQTQIHNSNQVSHGHGGYGHGHGLTHTHSVDQNKVHGCGQTQTMCTDQNKAHGYCQTQTQTQTHATNGMATCQGRSKKRGEQKKRGMFQRIKEGIAGDSSSSESDSDDENCGKRKN
ncbi:uncharacterized protein LOC116129340 [Pistacia vera]|uniref:uncharacterized protein LOC116129340 n=1 Tax=Pistacia vera TaxID=55513 RepID=UPI001263D899|nr:uncharacterized protein LOC116129340 [Pistacia vera]